MKAFLIFLLLFSFAFGEEKHKHGDHEFHMPRDMGYLHLDEGQRDKISKILSKNERDLEELHRRKELAEMKTKRLFLEKDFDIKAYKRLMVELKTESVHIQAEMFRQMHDILTPKQRELFLYYMKEWEVE
ncbi:periplasmic heavy metal sensor [Sulfurimonas sp. HSL-1716]|uniref:Spy/CpxP family protein refolding chaperone n=1 Tax=Hydrocurvibacter sulfurireducens TaxID=3131937 RepID=UPI0031F9A9F0